MKGLAIAAAGLVPSTRTLTADLRWIPVGDVQQGMKLIAPVAENMPYRSRPWTTAEVLSVKKKRVRCLRLVLENGDALAASSNQAWLVRWGQTIGHERMKKWVPSSRLQKPRRASRLVLAFHPWAGPASDWESGYLAGFLDGEGSLMFELRRVCVTFSQAANPAFVRAVEILEKRGFSVWGKDRTYISKKAGTRPIHQIYIRGGLQDALRLLGEIRPPRLLERFTEFATTGNMPKLHGAKGVRVIEKEPIGTREVVTIETSTTTLVAEGYVCRNSPTVDLADLT